MAKNEKSAIKPILQKLSLAPELRAEESKGVFPQGHLRQIFAVFKAEMNNIMRANFWFILYAAPLIGLMIYLMPMMVSNVSSGFNFMGNVGVGYPGASDSIASGLIALYGVYKNIFWILAACLLVFGLGCAGMFNCCKKLMWGEKIKVTRDFYDGIKKFWWKFIIEFAVIALIIVAVAQTVLWHLSNMALGTAGAGSWILMIAVCLVALALLSINALLLPMTCTYKLNLLQLYKNAAILTSQMIIIALIIAVLVAVPVVLILTVQLLGFMVWMLMFMFGFMFYGLALTAFGQLAFDNILTPLYQLSIAPKASPEKKSGKPVKQPQGGKTAKPANYKKSK